MNQDIPGQDTSNDAVMRARLDSILGDARMPAGSLVAHILHDLFRSEVRQQGDDVAERAWKGLDASAVKELGREFAERISRPNGRDYMLPAGTVMTVGLFGCAFVGREELGLDVDRPGLHYERELPTRPGGSNLARLLHRVDELTQELPCRAIGMPTLVERCSGDHPEHHLQFPAFAPAGGVVLQRAMNYASWGEVFSAFTHTMIDQLAEDVVKDTQRLWIDGRSLAPNICSTRKTATGIASKARGVRVHAVTLDLSNQTSGGVRFAVEFEGWNHAFRRGVVVQEISARPGDNSELNAIALDLADKVAAVRLLGADGRIDVLARAIANAAPQGAAAVLANLAADFETFVTLPTRTGPVHLRLYWRHGEIGAKTWGGHKIEISRDTVKFRDETQPETLKISLQGRPLYAVFDEPFRCDARIARVENRCGNLVITPEPDPWMVDCRAGRMWPDAELTAIWAAAA